MKKLYLRYFQPPSRFNLSEISAVIALIRGKGPEKAKPYKIIKDPTADQFRKIFKIFNKPITNKTNQLTLQLHKDKQCQQQNVLMF